MDAIPHLVVAGSVPAEKMGGGENGKSPQVDRVDLQGFPHLLPGFFVVLRLQMQGRQKGVSFHVPGIHFQGLPNQLDRPAYSLEIQDPGLPQEGPGIPWIPLQHGPEGLPGVGGPVLLQKELTGQEIRAGVVRSDLGGVVEGQQGVLEKGGVGDSQVPDGGPHRHEIFRGQPTSGSVVEVDEGIEEGQGLLPIASVPHQDAQVQAGHVAVGGARLPWPSGRPPRLPGPGPRRKAPPQRHSRAPERAAVPPSPTTVLRASSYRPTSRRARAYARRTSNGASRSRERA